MEERKRGCKQTENIGGQKNILLGGDYTRFSSSVNAACFSRAYLNNTVSTLCPNRSFNKKWARLLGHTVK